ncbi:MAG: DUF3592 domain-containing protein [Capsulimonas sp.]|uniref:DUF3592 domain-containing protein n=1 Tax=Capsulimonas sp. TaxID=2494211 RepID=UPI0032644970
MTFHNTAQLTLADPPRDVKISPIGILVRVLVWLFCILQVAIMGSVLWAPIARDRMLEAGKPTMARVTDKISPPADGHDYRLRLKFHTAAGPVAEDVHVQEREFVAVKVGDERLVTYLPRDPSILKMGVVRPQETDRAEMNEVRLLLILAASLVFTIFLTEMMIRRQMRLLSTGHAAVATIERAQNTPKSGVRLTYQFEAESMIWTGSGNVSARRQFAAGQTIPIVYPPGQPRKSTPVASLYLTALRRS